MNALTRPPLAYPTNSMQYLLALPLILYPTSSMGKPHFHKIGGVALYPTSFIGDPISIELVGWPLKHRVLVCGGGSNRKLIIGKKRTFVVSRWGHSLCCSHLPEKRFGGGPLLFSLSIFRWCAHAQSSFQLLRAYPAAQLHHRAMPPKRVDPADLDFGEGQLTDFEIEPCRVSERAYRLCDWTL